MAGNSQRRGAVRKGASKKGPQVGSGGQRRRGLEGRGPTPKAEDRPKHKANRMATAAEKRAGGSGSKPGARPSASRGGSRRGKASSEIVAGRNSVVEALRADVPVTTMYVAGRIDSDDRVREALKTATAKGIAILETPRGELDRLTDGAVHQGLALQVPPYEYAHPQRLHRPASTRHTARGCPRRDHRPTQPRRHHPLGGGVRRPRRGRARASLGRHDRQRLEDVGRCRGPRARWRWPPT